MAFMKSVSSLRYGLLPASLASGQKSGQPLAMFISLIGRWKDVEVTSGRKASMMCSLLFWSKSIRVTWGERERRGCIVPFVCDGSGCTLADSHFSYLLAERPLEQSIILAPHDDEEQRQVCSSSRPIPIQIQSQTHFVTIFAGVKCYKKEEKPKCKESSNNGS